MRGVSNKHCLLTFFIIFLYFLRGFLMNVLMDQSYETTALEMGGEGGGGGGGVAGQMCVVFTFAWSPRCGGNVRDLLYLGEHDSEM